MVTITQERALDAPAREALLDRAFGKSRRRKTSERLRRGRLPAEGLAFTARSEDGAVIGTVRLWNITAGSAGPALLLGPLAVDAAHRKQGIGATLMRHALDAAKALGHKAVLLVGDEPYYSRFGFSRSDMERLMLPGPVMRERFLGLELVPGALGNANGMIAASGRIEERQRKAVAV
ncbi:MAG: GNAT family N-acetyltransferase [Parvibaculaceae bacterium]